MNCFDYLITDKGGPGLVPRLERVPRLKQSPPSEREDIFSAANTAYLLHELGDDAPIADEEESNRAREIFETGRDPTPHEKRIPALVLHLESLMTEYDHDLLRDVGTIRNYVTNRLLEESTGRDPKVRIKALQMLGDITEVGLFTHRSEVTVTNKTEEELAQLIREKLARAVKGTRIDNNVQDADFIESKKAAQTTSLDDVLKKISGHGDADL